MEPNLELVQLLHTYKEQKEFADRIIARVEEMKRDLVKMVESQGFTDDRGHQWLSAGDHQLKRERRVSVSFNSGYAEQWARENGLWDEVKEVLEVISEEKLLATLWENEEMKDKMDDFYTKRESYAFKVVEGKSYDDE